MQCDSFLLIHHYPLFTLWYVLHCVGLCNFCDYVYCILFTHCNCSCKGESRRKLRLYTHKTFRDQRLVLNYTKHSNHQFFTQLCFSQTKIYLGKKSKLGLTTGCFFWPSLNLTKSQAHHKFLDLWNWGEGQLKGTQGFLRCLFKSGANPVKKGIFPNILLSKFIFLVLTSKTCFGFIDFLPLHKHKN